MERGDKKGLESKMDQYITMKKGFEMGVVGGSLRFIERDITKG
jgi:hypothetical protein